ncbi:MAG: cytochrome c1 [Gammaproteobacteria bacterium]
MIRWTKVLIACLIVFSPAAWAASGDVHLDKANVNINDRLSLQRGAKYFVNYCLSCHSAAFMRYNRMGRDLGLSDDDVAANLIFTSAKVGDLMTVTMRPDDSREWLLAPAPDLSVVARARGVDWLYTYLRSFYVDESRPFGVNNVVFENVSMPHVLWELQGWQTLRHEEQQHSEEGGHDAHAGPTLELTRPGKLAPKEYDRLVRDLVNFLAYLAEPAQLQRQKLGFWVLLFLVFLFVLTYLMKKEYWKDVH